MTVTVTAVEMVFDLVFLELALCRPGLITNAALMGEMIHGAHVLPERSLRPEVAWAGVALKSWPLMVSRLTMILAGSPSCRKLLPAGAAFEVCVGQHLENGVECPGVPRA